MNANPFLLSSSMLASDIRAHLWWPISLGLVGISEPLFELIIVTQATSRID